LFILVDGSTFDRFHNNLAISIDKNSGIVKTTNELGRAHVFISSTEDFDILQSLDIPIEVNLFYIN